MCRMRKPAPTISLGSSSRHAGSFLAASSRVNANLELPNLTMALEIIQSAKSLGLRTLPRDTLQRLANLLHHLPPEQKLCVFHGLAHLYTPRVRFKS